MSILDQIAAGGTPPANPLDTMAKIQALRTGQMQQQALALENQQRQVAVQNQQALTKAYQQWDPTQGYESLAHLAIQNGATGDTAMAIQKHAMDYAKEASDKAKADSETGKNNLESEMKQHDFIAGQIGNAMNAPDDQLPNAIVQTAQRLSTMRGYDGKPLLDPQHVQTAQNIAQMPPDQARTALSMLQKDYMGQVAIQQAAKTAADIKAAGIKDFGGVPYDITGPTPKPLGPMTTADAVTAPILGMKAGDPIPLATAKQAKETAAVGVKETDFNGKRQVINELDPNVPARVLGNSPAVTTFNLQNAVPKGQNGQPSQLAQMVANGQMKWNDAVSARWPLATKAAFAAEVKSINPNFNSGDFDVEKKVREDFTSGTDSNTLNSINRAREHMQVFLQTAKDLDNGNVQAFNRLGKAFETQFGSDKATNLSIAKQAFSSEVGKAFAGASVAEGDRKEIGSQISSASSFQQLAGVARTADQLLAGAQKVLKQKYDQGTQGKPNFGEQAPGALDGGGSGSKTFDWNSHPKVQ
jgi:hypothetical protein